MYTDDILRFLPPDHVSLRDWNIIIVDVPNECHEEIFVGYSEGDRLGRLSTPIKNYDANTGIGETRSGSSYMTIGEPGSPHDDAIYVLEQTFGKDLIERELFSDSGQSVLAFKYPLNK
ncbi:MAG TPA: hypothetical protein ENH74_01270 [Methylophaga sp.]|nr:hypothetical protein [Methylophaga sp.]